MARGVIKFYSEHRGYGFIRREESGNPLEVVYVHYSQIKGVSRLQEGQSVTFDLKEGARGREAVNVHAVS